MNKTEPTATRFLPLRYDLTTHAIFTADGYGMMQASGELVPTRPLEDAYWCNPPESAEEVRALFALIVRAVNCHGLMLKALKEIQKGEGAFSRDPLIHAGNCIEDMKALATAAIRAAEQAGA